MKREVKGSGKVASTITSLAARCNVFLCFTAEDGLMLEGMPLKNCKPTGITFT